jgi:hypothetical protein
MTTKAIATIKRSPDLSGCGNASDAILDQTCINTIRTLSMDAVQQANSGHPGTPLALQKDAPLHRAVQRSGVIVAIPILAGLHHQYVRI